ncbi:unnamed protein product, partial [Iphiclides podalirius]
MRDSNWNRTKKQRSRPVGLKGREIGLYYKNLNRAKKENKERAITLTIPRPVISSVKSNLQQIIHIAKDNNIQLPQIVTTTSFGLKIKNEVFHETEDLDASCSMRNDSNFKLPGVSINFNDQLTNDLSSAFHKEYMDMLTKKPYKKLLKFREILPAYKKAEDVLNLINNNQVIVVSGETGCGKSTQIPQLILDDAIKNNKGANVKIMVTQPRRIAASSLAARVAEERCEKMGNSVGYSVRLEKVEERNRGSIQYCTTGVLLVELEVNQGLTNWSHVILDEVHERDCHVDMSMCMLKQVLKRRKDLKLILMSATLDADSLSHYYNNCPVMHIEGLAYPVQDVYLEDILQITKFKLLDDSYTQKKRPKWHQYAHKNFGASAMEKDIKYKAEIGKLHKT